ncbi:MAG: hypothetical protein ACT4N8_00835 [Sphingosinicella sp.]
MAFLLQQRADAAEAGGLVLSAREAAVQAALARAARAALFAPRRGRR